LWAAVLPKWETTAHQGAIVTPDCATFRCA
jgi:hypothetical protein